MATLSGGERRRYDRSERDDFALSLWNGAQSFTDVQLRDVTAYGMGVLTPTELKAGQKLRFEMRVPGGTVAGQAAVVWAEPFHMGYRGGLRVTSLGYFARRKLKKALATPRGEAGGGGVFDTLLLLAAVAIMAMVAADLARNPAQFKAILSKVLAKPAPQAAAEPAAP